MINLYNTESNTSFKCYIVDYENPKENWCLLKIRVEQDGKVFEAIDPAIETTELPNLLNWFRCLSERKLPEYARLTFTEPCIGFEFLNNKNGTVRISIVLSHELRPKLMNDEEDYKIIFDLDDKDFENILYGITNTIAKFPIRNKKYSF